MMNEGEIHSPDASSARRKIEARLGAV